MLEKQCLGADIKKWHQQQHICPQVIPFVFSEPDKSPEWEKLFLPSDFTSSEQTKLGLEILGQRSSNCNKAKNTRGVQKIRDVQTRIQNYVKKYRHAHVTMIALGCNPEDPKFGFPQLRDEDLYTKNVDQPHNLGDGGKRRLNILDYCFNSHHSMAAGVQWHRARADMERWQEKVEILGQEFCRAIQGFNKMETVWTALAHNHENEPGKKAYALQVAGMYQQMGKDAQEQFEKVGGTWLKAGASTTQAELTFYSKKLEKIALIVKGNPERYWSKVPSTNGAPLQQVHSELGRRSTNGGARDIRTAPDALMALKDSSVARGNPNDIGPKCPKLGQCESSGYLDHAEHTDGFERLLHRQEQPDDIGPKCRTVGMMTGKCALNWDRDHQFNKCTVNWDADPQIG
ncbi:hypothetical protein C8R45DRAFT_941924 [Mycena sanguinolenta]|nr:hypothetical protein C8R45DRAFT_941924 [Mycena sanguinolenta]